MTEEQDPMALSSWLATQYMQSPGVAISKKEKSRNRRIALAQSQGRSLRKYQKAPIGEVVDQTARRREYKRLQRRKAGAPLRADIAAKAQAKREAKAIKTAIRKQLSELHDAHVKRYARVLRSREASAKRFRENPQFHRDRISRYKQSLPDSYVIQNLKSAGILKEVITPSLIELKREAMQYERLARHIKSTVKNHLKDQNEAITKHP